jgi:hypothetical protein
MKWRSDATSVIHAGLRRAAAPPPAPNAFQAVGVVNARGLESGIIILVRAVAIEYNETSAISIEFAIRGNIDALAGVG